jgi:hypothetical protein
MTGTDAVLATAFATMLANQAGGLFVRQVAVGSPIGSTGPYTKRNTEALPFSGASVLRLMKSQPGLAPCG